MYMEIIVYTGICPCAWEAGWYRDVPIYMRTMLYTGMSICKGTGDCVHGTCRLCSCTWSKVLCIGMYLFEGDYDM